MHLCRQPSIAQATATALSPQEETRIRALARRLKYLKDPPTDEQITALGRAIHKEIARAYREQIRAEAAKLGLRAFGPLDPFIDAVLQHDAQVAARQVTDTYVRRRAKAAARGDDLGAWQARYADGKAPQVFDFETGKAQNRATRSFYANNSQLVATAHVDPTDAAIPDICADWIGLGEIPVDEIPGDLPAHQNCPHAWVVTPASQESGTDVGDDGDLSLADDGSDLPTPGLGGSGQSRSGAVGKPLLPGSSSATGGGSGSGESSSEGVGAGLNAAATLLKDTLWSAGMILSLLPAATDNEDNEDNEDGDDSAS